MSLIRINAGVNGPELHSRRHSLLPVLARGVEQPGPVIVMIHGSGFAPHHPFACPHDKILGTKPRRESRTSRSWPRGLGFGSGVSREGLGIAFGWPANGSIWRAYAQAEMAGTALSQVIKTIHDLAPRRTIYAFAHSLGAQVVLSALPHLPASALSRVILLSGNKLVSRAASALNSPAGRSAEIINITSRKNNAYDFIPEKFLPPATRKNRTRDHGIPDRRNILTIQMDNSDTLQALLRCGFRIAPSASRVFRWSPDRRPGVFQLYRALLRRSDRIDLDHLRNVLPSGPESRWSNMLPLPLMRTRSNQGKLRN